MQVVPSFGSCTPRGRKSFAFNGCAGSTECSEALEARGSAGYHGMRGFPSTVIRGLHGFRGWIPWKFQGTHGPTQKRSWIVLGLFTRFLIKQSNQIDFGVGLPSNIFQSSKECSSDSYSDSELRVKFSCGWESADATSSPLFQTQN